MKPVIPWILSALLPLWLMTAPANPDQHHQNAGVVVSLASAPSFQDHATQTDTRLQWESHLSGLVCSPFLNASAALAPAPGRHLRQRAVQTLPTDLNPRSPPIAPC